MKKKGFTLIELLAVIVILAIVAFVATPIVLNVINSSKEKARLSGAYGVLDAARLEYIERMYNDAEITKNNMLSGLKISGEKPTGDVRMNENGEIAVALLYDSNKCYKKGFSDSDILLTILGADDSCVIDNLPIDYVYSQTVINLMNSAITSSDDSRYGQDGLYLENGIYRYKGGNPDNYVRLFEGEEGLFRIISIDSQGVKLISNKEYSGIAWDKGGVNIINCTDETCPRYNENNSYCMRSLNRSDYYGCNVYGNSYEGSVVEETIYGDHGEIVGYYDTQLVVTTESNMLHYLRDTYYQTYLTSLDDKIVQTAKWNVGTISEVPSTRDILYGTRSVSEYSVGINYLIDEERSESWYGKIGLMNPSDYILASRLDRMSFIGYVDIFAPKSNWLNTDEEYDSDSGDPRTYSEFVDTWTMNPLRYQEDDYGEMYPGYVEALSSGHVAVYETEDYSTRPVIYLRTDAEFTMEHLGNNPGENNNDNPEEPSQLIRSTSVQALIDRALTTSGDGLYRDTNDNTYRYRGSNPANYIRLFADHNGMSGLYRIVSIDEQGIKVISEENVTTRMWDGGLEHLSSQSCTNETCPRNNSNNTYCTSSNGKYLGCNAWSAVSDTYTNGDYSGTVTQDSGILTYLKNDYYVNNLSSISSKIIQNATWNIGGFDDGNLSELLVSEANKTWNGKIGLINISDYVRAHLPDGVTNYCIDPIYFNGDCGVNNWLDLGNTYWMINMDDSTTTFAFVANTYNIGYVNSFWASEPLGVRPVVYLRPDITIGNESGVDAAHAITILP